MVAPAVPPLLASYLSCVVHGGPSGYDPQIIVLGTAALVAWSWTYPTALVLGLPALLLLRERARARMTLVTCTLVAASIAVIPLILISLLVPAADYASFGLRVTATEGEASSLGWVTAVRFLGVAAIMGATGGAAFWLVAASRTARGASQAVRRS